VEWIRFEADATVPDLVRRVPHVALEKVSKRIEPTVADLSARPKGLADWVLRR